MRQPSILDVVSGVKTVASTHPEVTAWWYTPPQRLRLAGELPGSGAAALRLEVVVQGAFNGTSSALAFQQIARELSIAMSGVAVDVRLHRGSAEERPLFRILSRLEESGSNQAPRTA